MKEGQLQTIFDSISDSNLNDYKISADELQDQLLKFNLTSNQAKVYIFLGKYGSKTAPEVCKALKIARTETYHLLSTLQSKGIVLATFGHPIKFSAIPVNKAIQTLVNTEKDRIKTLEKQEETITKLWDSIPNFVQEKTEDNENKFQMLQGPNPINGKLNDMIKSAQNEVLVLGNERDYLRLYHSDFLMNLQTKKIQTKFITNCSEKTQYVFENIDQKQIKIMPKKIDDDLCFVIRDNKEIIFFTKKSNNSSQNPVAMWTDSTSIISSMKLLFSFIWATSKSI